MKKTEPIKAVVTAPVEPVKPRRKFDRNFKKEAVALWLNSGRPAREIARELGIGENRLYLWRQKFAPVTPAKQADLENEVQGLRRENAELRQQRDILKKTLGILSAPPSNGISGLIL
jgi:transposase